MPLKPTDNRSIFKTLKERKDQQSIKSSCLSLRCFNAFSHKKSEEIMMMTKDSYKGIDSVNKSRFAGIYDIREEKSPFNENDLNPNPLDIAHIPQKKVHIEEDVNGKTQREKQTDEIEMPMNIRNPSERDFDDLRQRNTISQKNLNISSKVPSLNWNNSSRNQIKTADHVENDTERLINTVSEKVLNSIREQNETTANFQRRQKRYCFLQENHGFRNMTVEQFYPLKETKIYPTTYSDMRISKHKIKKILAGTNKKVDSLKTNSGAIINKGLGNIDSPLNNNNFFDPLFLNSKFRMEQLFQKHRVNKVINFLYET